MSWEAYRNGERTGSRRESLLKQRNRALGYGVENGRVKTHHDVRFSKGMIAGKSLLQRWMPSSKRRKAEAGDPKGGSLEPVISVIMPVLNSRAVIEVALNSLISQNIRCFEVILSDGGSVDGTVSHALKTLQDHAINALAVVANGSSIYGAINHAIRMARGEWIFVLGSDDALYSTSIFDEIHRHLMATNADVVYGDAWFEAKEGFIYGGPFWLNRLVALNICHQAIFYRASRIAQLELTYEEKYPLLADWNYNLKLFSCCRFEHVPLVISRFSCVGQSSTHIDHRFEQDRYKRIMEYFGWRSFFLLSPDWLSCCVEQQPSRLHRVGLMMNRLMHKLLRLVVPKRSSQNLRQLVFAGSQLPLNL